jgi:hypothetical protein
MPGVILITSKFTATHCYGAFMSDSNREWGGNTDAAIRRRNLTLSEKQILRVSQRVIPKSCKHMSEQERLDGTRQMIRDLERLAIDDGCIAAAWALDFIRCVTFQSP